MNDFLEKYFSAFSDKRPELGNISANLVSGRDCNIRRTAVLESGSSRTCKKQTWYSPTDLCADNKINTLKHSLQGAADALLIMIIAGLIVAFLFHRPDSV